MCRDLPDQLDASGGPAPLDGAGIEKGMTSYAIKDQNAFFSGAIEQNYWMGLHALALLRNLCHPLCKTGNR